MAQPQYPFDLGTALADPGVANAQLNYNVGLKSLQLQQDLAKSLLEDSDRPTSSGIGARGMAYRVSPLEGLARALSGGAGALVAQQGVEQAKALDRTYAQQVGQRLKQGNNTGQPAQTAANPFQQGNNTGGQSAGDVIAFIKQQEGFNPKPYPDGKQTSVGYGTKAQPGDENGITPEEGHARLVKELGPINDWIDKNVKVPLTQSQYTGLASFGYNTGALDKILPDINSGNWKAVADHMGQYIHQDGKVLPGLVARRNTEGSMLLQQSAPAAQPAAAQQQQVPWHIEGQDDNAMRLFFLAKPQEFATVKAAAIRANAPTEMERALAQTSLSPQQRDQFMQAWVREKAGLVQPKEGTQVTYNAAGHASMQPIPGAAAAKGELKGAEAASAKAGEQAAGYQQEIDERARNANDLLRTLGEMKNLNTNPGLFAGVKEDVGRFFRSMGVSDDTIQKYLKVSPGDLEASQKLTAQMAIEAVRQISNRPTQVEFMKFLAANPNIFQTPEGLKRVIQFMQNSANDTVNEQKAFYQAKTGIDPRFPNGLRPENYRDFEQLHNIERQERIRAGQLNSTPLQPGPLAAQPAQAPAVGTPPAAGAPAVKRINGKDYYQQGGQWYEGTP